MENLITQLELGDLVAFFYRNRSDQLAFVIPYLKAGLEKNQRCLYIADDTPIGLILDKLEQAGVNVDRETKRGALDVLTKHETYLRHGVFEPDKMIADLELEVQACLAKGFSGLRGSGDMTWALDHPSALAKMIDYQSKLQQRFPRKFLAVCQYDESRFPAAVVKQMECSHSAIIRDRQLTRCPG